MKWPFFSVFLFTLTVITCKNPGLIANNKFIENFISEQILAITIVLLTVTMAAATKIHQSISLLNINFHSKGKDKSEDLQNARNELSENVWYMFYSFCLLLIILCAHGYSEQVYLKAITDALGLVILVFNLLVVHDIYGTSYILDAHEDQPPSSDN